MQRSARTALLVWGGLSVLVAASALILWLRLGPEGIEAFIQQPPLINLPVTLASVALVWLSAGVLLYRLQAGYISGSNFIGVGGLFVVLTTYLNFLSERWRYGDYTYYFESAGTMYRNEHLHGSYFYPPLWATLTQYLYPAGEQTFFFVLWLLNVISLAAFYVLLIRVLQRYGFGERLAALVTILFMLANAPLLRTLAYVQVNLHTLNLILLAILLYPRQRLLSALMLALAVHLKSSPVVLVLPFLLERDRRWIVWFAIAALSVAALTLITDGWTPFRDVLEHWRELALAENTIYHDTSFDSFLRSTAKLLGVDLLWARVLTYVFKGLLTAASLWTMVRCIRGQQFVKSREQGARVLNGVPPLFILFTLAAPLVWEHHAVFVALPFLLMIKRLESAHEWLWFGLAYVLEFLLPTFDFYPWSFGRLVAPLLVLWQMWWLSDRAGDAGAFKQLNRWMEKLPAPKLA